ncbi:unnamed protein product [Onchocerca flexuosa]|uniref:Uncharacterized protein n=1 Tax=Onchocerca flexuosa TaxID=387005 RepID=A0A183HJC8_9BILA|nr:unnamed protein product [Onchocerca flexuosa]
MRGFCGDDQTDHAAANQSLIVLWTKQNSKNYFVLKLKILFINICICIVSYHLATPSKKRQQQPQAVMITIDRHNGWH